MTTPSKAQLEEKITALLDQIPQYETLIDRRSTKFWLKLSRNKSLSNLFSNPIFGFSLLGAPVIVPFSLAATLPSTMAAILSMAVIPTVIAPIYAMFKIQKVAGDHSAEQKNKELKDAIEFIKFISLSADLRQKIVLAIENKKLPAIFWKNFNDYAQAIEQNEKKDRAAQKIQNDLKAARQELLNLNNPELPSLVDYDLSATYQNQAPSQLNDDAHRNIDQTITIDVVDDDLVKMGDLPEASAAEARKFKGRGI